MCRVMKALRKIVSFLKKPEQEEHMMRNIPVIDVIRTGQRITELRKAAGLTVRDLQEIFGFTTPQAIYKWQHGTAMPTIDNLVVLSVVFGVSVDDILIIQGADTALALGA